MKDLREKDFDYFVQEVKELIRQVRLKSRTKLFPKGASTESKLVARHLSDRKAGVYRDPKVELQALDRILDSEYLTPTERKWASRRKVVLLSRMNKKKNLYEIYGEVVK